MTDDATIRLLDDIEGRAYTELFAAAPADLAASFGVRVIHAGGALVLRAAKIPTSVFNRALGLGVRAPATEADLDAVLEALRGTAYYLHLSPVAQPAELRGWIAAHGLVPAWRPAWVKMMRGPGPPPVVETPLAVRELDAAGAPAFGRVVASAFEMPATLAPWMAAIVGRPRWRVFGAFDGEELVAGGAVFVDGANGWLGIGGTLPAHRGKHAQRAVMAARIAAAGDAGCTLLTTETGAPRSDSERNPSLVNMLACGFQRAFTRPNFELV